MLDICFYFTNQFKFKKKAKVIKKLCLKMYKILPVLFFSVLFLDQPSEREYSKFVCKDRDNPDIPETF